MTDITVILMFVMAVGVTVMLTVFGIAMFRNAQHAEKKAAQSSKAAATATPAPAEAPSWAPPRYDAAGPAITGPSLRVGLAVVQPQAESLLLTWNAVNDGGEPVMVLWGSPQVRLDGAGGVQLWYTYTPPQDGPVALPEARLCAPGEIVSRTVSLPAAALGGAVRGLKLNVIVGFGPAAAYEAARDSAETFARWQQMAVSLPRTVPA